MAYHQLSRHFRTFLSSINPSPAFQDRAATEHATITGLLSDPSGYASALSPYCFLQGSYKQDTAIHSINDIDIVALCSLWYPPVPGGAGATWTRDQIFETVAAPLVHDLRYKDKVQYNAGSMCIKVDLGIKIEILPVVFQQGNNDRTVEPFILYRPERQIWEVGYARYHQAWLSHKNAFDQTNGNFIPSIKIVKHMRDLIGLQAVSFHLECLLFSLPNELFAGQVADYLPAILNHLASADAISWWNRSIMTPCRDRDIFTPSEWSFDNWAVFHSSLVTWAAVASMALDARDSDGAIRLWQTLLGDAYFPAYA